MQAADAMDFSRAYGPVPDPPRVASDFFGSDRQSPRRYAPGLLPHYAKKIAVFRDRLGQFSTIVSGSILNDF
jgi:hypothetical protein